ncbi:MAG TPA: AAA family ATPase [Myxococcaceae bacterium]|nr:AAA family ATPase [Myxococcaceae bacterium]
MITTLMLQDVRTFTGRHEITIKPLTLLVGENSTGKTTIMAMLSAVLDPNGFPTRPAFNKAPYDLGSYDTIATYKGGKYGRAKRFVLGRRSTIEHRPVSATSTYINAGGEPELARFEIQRDGSSLEVDFQANTVLVRSTSKGEAFVYKASLSAQKQLSRDRLLMIGGGVFSIRMLVVNVIKRNQRALRVVDNLVLSSGMLYGAPGDSLRDAVSLAPVRTRPRRTYDVLAEGFEPEGDHVPAVLARALRSTSPENERLRSQLRGFGHEAGLFEDLAVKRLGKRPGDPIQILVEGTGRAANLIDVGYGVSQALPIVVQTAVVGGRSILLLQQPEVHLHPKAQAAMGTYFAQMVARDEAHFVIETHSDYLVDRIRQEVAIGTLSPKDIALIFLERDGVVTRTHSIELDRRGNVTNAPLSYRRFFMEEELRIMHRSPVKRVK